MTVLFFKVEDVLNFQGSEAIAPSGKVGVVDRLVKEMKQKEQAYNNKQDNKTYNNYYEKDTYTKWEYFFTYIKYYQVSKIRKVFACIFVVLETIICSILQIINYLLC